MISFQTYRKSYERKIIFEIFRISQTYRKICKTLEIQTASALNTKCRKMKNRHKLFQKMARKKFALSSTTKIVRKIVFLMSCKGNCWRGLNCSRRRRAKSFSCLQISYLYILLFVVVFVAFLLPSERNMKRN